LALLFFSSWKDSIQTPGVKPPDYPSAPWILGLALIGTGTIALVIALWEYRWVIRYLWSDEYKPIAGVGHRWHTPITAVTVVLILIGILAFVAVLLRVREKRPQARFNLVR
jgi:putative membrane protein